MIKEYVKLWAACYTLPENAREELFIDCWLTDLPVFVTVVLQFWDGSSITICPIN